MNWYLLVWKTFILFCDLYWNLFTVRLGCQHDSFPLLLPSLIQVAATDRHIFSFTLRRGLLNCCSLLESVSQQLIKLRRVFCGLFTSSDIGTVDDPHSKLSFIPPLLLTLINVFWFANKVFCIISFQVSVKNT